jgi:hypothetical protein
VEAWVQFSADQYFSVSSGFQTELGTLELLPAASYQLDTGK